ncbi:MAG TPA: AMP-binding protein, partial [Actinomycetes bacterium]|nr:AMP-binding protein [Actinomycetes bacterium]
MSDHGGANLAEYVRQAAAQRPDGPALAVGATRLTWADVDRAVDAASAGFLAAGLTQGDRIGLFLGNCPEFVIAYFGVLRAGLVAVPLNPGLTAPELGPLLTHAGAKLVVADADSMPALRLTGADVQVVVAGPDASGERSFDALLEAGRSGQPSGDQVETGVGGEDLAVILYTSGTSGEPKGAMLTHRALRGSIEQVASLERPIATPDDVVLLVLPLAHIYSLNGTLGAVVRQAATAVLVDHFDPEATLRLIQQHHVTNIPGAPAIWAAWAKRPDLAPALAGVRLLFSGSAGLPVDVQQQVLATTGLFVHEGYGLTEAAPGVSSTLVSGSTTSGSVGQPFPGVEVRLVD